MMPLSYHVLFLIILTLSSIGSVNSTEKDDSSKGKRTHEQAFVLKPSSSSHKHKPQPQSDPPIVLQQGAPSYLPPYFPSFSVDNSNTGPSDGNPALVTYSQDDLWDNLLNDEDYLAAQQSGKTDPQLMDEDDTFWGFEDIQLLHSPLARKQNIGDLPSPIGHHQISSSATANVPAVASDVLKPRSLGGPKRTENQRGRSIGSKNKKNAVGHSNAGTSMPLKQRTKNRKKTSDVWDHFEETADGRKAKCKYCQNDIRKQTYGMRNHLQSKHNLGLAAQMLKPQSKGKQAASTQQNDSSGETPIPFP